MKSILSKKNLLVTCLLLFLFQSYAQDQLVLWDFERLPSEGIEDGTDIDAEIGRGTLEQNYASISPRGTLGTPYTDIEGVSRAASNAISWDDPYDDGEEEEADIRMYFTTKGFKDMFLRFDYKSAGADNFDLEYRDNGGPFNMILDNDTLINDNAWHSKTIDLTAEVGLNDKNRVIWFYIRDFVRNDGNNDKLTFDNVEFYGTKIVNCEPYLASATPYAGSLCVSQTASLDVSAFDAANSLSGETYTYKNLGGTGSVSVSHFDNSSSAATVTGISVGTADLRLVVEDAGGCKDSVTFSVTVNESPAQLAQQNCGNCGKIKINICQFAAFPNLDGIIAGGNANYEAGASLNWYKNTGGAPGAAIAGSPTFNNNKPKTKKYWVSQVQNGCEGDPIMVIVKVRAATSVAFDLPHIGCQYGLLDLSDWVSDALGTASSYTFYDTDPSVGSPTPLGSVTATHGAVPVTQFVIEELETGLQTYYVVADNGFGCNTAAQSTIQVYAKPSITATSDKSVDHGDAVNISFSGAPGPVGFFWMNDETAIGLGAVGIGSISFVADNTTGQSLVANIKVLANNEYCTSGWDDFTITVAPSPGPVRLAKATGPSNFLRFLALKVNEADVQLSWTSTFEGLIQGYEVEKRVNNATEFEAIGQLAPLGGNHDYQLLDQRGMGTQTIYRLKVALLDGSIQYAEEIEVGFDFVDNNRFSVYPNPNTGRFTLEASFPVEGAYSWEITNVMGQVIRKGSIDQQSQSFDISHLSQGVYHIVMTSSEGKRYLNRVIKE